MVVPRVHYVVIVSPLEPDARISWPSVDFELKGIDVYPDGLLRVLMSAPAYWRAEDVLRAFEDWGECSVNVDSAYPLPCPRGSVWNTHQHALGLLRAYLDNFQYDCYAHYRIVQK